MRESATYPISLWDMCHVRREGTKEREKKKDEISGPAGDDRRVVRNVYECTDTTCQVPIPPPRQQKQGRQVSVKGT